MAIVKRGRESRIRTKLMHTDGAARCSKVRGNGRTHQIRSISRRWHPVSDDAYTQGVPGGRQMLHVPAFDPDRGWPAPVTARTRISTRGSRIGGENGALRYARGRASVDAPRTNDR